MSYLTQLGNPGKSKYLLTAMFRVKMFIEQYLVGVFYCTEIHVDEIEYKRQL